MERKVLSRVVPFLFSPFPLRIEFADSGEGDSLKYENANKTRTAASSSRGHDDVATRA